MDLNTQIANPRLVGKIADHPGDPWWLSPWVGALISALSFVGYALIWVSLLALVI